MREVFEVTFLKSLTTLLIPFSRIPVFLSLRAPFRFVFFSHVGGFKRFVTILRRAIASVFTCVGSSRSVVFLEVDFLGLTRRVITTNRAP